MFKVTTQLVDQRPHLSGVKLTDETLSDEQLLQLCQQYGSQAKLWKQRFLGLLPEVAKRELYLQKGCSSVFEFAAKLGGVSREQVKRVLQLNEKFQSSPELKQALVSGEISVAKLARVASVATPENQEFWFNQAQLLSSRALETLVRDFKTIPANDSVHVHTFNSNKSEQSGKMRFGMLKVAQSDKLNFTLETKERLLALQNKGFDLSQVLNELLDQREEQIQQVKEEIICEMEQKSVEDGLSRKQQVSKSRYIPIKIKRVLKQEYGNKCAQENCTNKLSNIHHTRRFALNFSHNPLYLAPLCKAHHEIAHSIDVRVVEKRRKIDLHK